MCVCVCACTVSPQLKLKLKLFSADTLSLGRGCRNPTGHAPKPRAAACSRCPANDCVVFLQTDQTSEWRAAGLRQSQCATPPDATGGVDEHLPLKCISTFVWRAAAAE